MLESNQFDSETPGNAWYLWGPYLSERQWGTVREDYSPFGAAWDFLPHDHARSQAYRWGEDGIGGISDQQQLLCFAPAFWNGKDPILKERLFGLTGIEGNHSEDVKELYYYLDNSPKHTFMRYLYKYPLNAFPYSEIVSKNKERTKHNKEFEIQDTSVFQEGNYANIEIKYAKANPKHLLIEIVITNKSDQEASLWVLPTLWFRNIWRYNQELEMPEITLNNDVITATCNHLGTYQLITHQKPQKVLFTNNETNAERLFGLQSYTEHVKDAFHEYVVGNNPFAVNPENVGTKSAYLFHLNVLPNQNKCLRFELKVPESPSINFTNAMEVCITENEKLYNSLIHTPIYKTIAKQAYAGLLWTKQYYEFNVKQWLSGDPGQHPPPESRKFGRNSGWEHLYAKDVLLMPDKWEYPWFAAWDSAFHCIAMARIDPNFAKHQLLLFLTHRYMHPNGQIPAYEWAFGDVNPPVHCIGVWEVYCIDKQLQGTPDLEFLKNAYEALKKNLEWWHLNEQIGTTGLYKGGFMGLDNVSVIDRGALNDTSFILAQVDTTCWIAQFALLMARIGMELQDEKNQILMYLQQFAKISQSLELLFDPISGNYYDCLYSKSSLQKIEDIQVQNITGLFPLLIHTEIPDVLVKQYSECFTEFKSNYPDKLMEGTSYLRVSGISNTRSIHLIDKAMSTDEYLGAYGLRSLSYKHAHGIVDIDLPLKKFPLRYTAEESETTNFGENSNWRGPVWIPTNYLIIKAIYSHEKCNLKNQNKPTYTFELCRRVINIFIRKNDHTPLYTNDLIVNQNPDFNQYLLFYEFFNPETGAGCGASHQTGWSALITELIQILESE